MASRDAGLALKNARLTSGWRFRPVAASKDQGQAGTQPVSAEPQLAQLAPEPEASSVQQLEAAVTPPPQQQQQQQQQPPPEERLGGTTYDLPLF
jgi:hypothetical protein